MVKRNGDRAADEKGRHERNLAIDPVILGEIRFGILMLPPGRRHRDLHHRLDEFTSRAHCVP